MGDWRGTYRSRLARVAVGSGVTMLLAFAAVSCSDDGGSADSGAAAATSASGAPGAGDVANGEVLARSKGCAGCHGPDFDGGAGPGWIGLAGSEVELVDGSVVVADTDYLVRAIADPSAELVADYTLKMPANNLSDAEIVDIVAYIESLADG
ncbi:MAG TPA: cytochrome c [Ilumatobacteraceae bacterium]|nr:cytochrome c [Ilumatobacteraceae bacterium]